MTLKGIVDRLKGEYAFIKTEEREYFVRKEEFLPPELMKPKQKVKFQGAQTHRGWQAFHVRAG
jgi:cold shock CspA family protein